MIGSILRTIAFLIVSLAAANSYAQSKIRIGNEVPAEVERISNLAVEWLAKYQSSQGDWDGGNDSHNPGAGNCGVTGLAAMAFLSTGVDPNFGSYGGNIRAAIRHIISLQDPKTGYLPNSMYNHGFGMLALAEAYGVLDEDMLWKDDGVSTPADRRRTIGEALHLSVRCAVTSQENNPWRAWRYRPESTDADTSVTGAVLIGLLAARNAGVKVPDANIDAAMLYLRQVTNKRGDVNYTAGFGIGMGPNMAAIACLAYAIGKHQDWPEFTATQGFLKAHANEFDSSHPHYNLYYMSQALFQADFETWSKWNQLTMRRLRRDQNPDGSFESVHGKAYATAMSVLALALNYRFLPIYER
ncbi:MAG: prenyltransferase/squalene oxidase repeat-containing protein [Pirellula sp.]